MVTFSLEPAIPSLISLAAFLLIPAIVRSYLMNWRAMQIYDQQEGEVPTSQRFLKLRIEAGWLLCLGFHLIFILILPFKESWLDAIPILRPIRNTVPDIALAFVMTSATTRILSHLIYPDRIIYRHKYTAEPVFDSMQFRERTSSFETIGDFLDSTSLRTRFTRFAICFAAVEVLKKIDNQAILYTSAVSGAIFRTAIMQSHPNTLGGLSLQEHIQRPGGSYLYLRSTAGFLILLRLAAKFDAVATRTFFQDLFGTNIVSYMQSDIAYMQYVVLTFTFAWNYYAILGPASLVCLAYSYDIEKAESKIKSINKSIAAKIIEVSQETQASVPVDGFGRFRICTYYLSLMRSKIPPVSHTPTYIAAYRTLLVCQIIGVMVDATGWWPAAKYPEDSVDLGRLLYFSIWPLISYPIVCVAMIVSAICHSKDGKYDDLWTYRHDWTMQHRPDLALVQQDPLDRPRTRSHPLDKLSSFLPSLL